MRDVLASASIALLLAVVVNTATTGASQVDAAAGATESGPATAAASASEGSQASRGAAIYAFACAVCHGGSGQGFAEAVAAFPADYQQCARCHQPQNAPQMPGSQVGLSVMAFSLGDPPALADAARLARFGSAAGLYHYLRATMPRWAPGSLEDEAYLDVTAHLLRLAGLLPEDEELDPEQLERRRLE